MKDLATKRDHPPAAYALARELYMTTSKPWKEIAQLCEIPEAAIKRRARHDKWLEARDDMEKAMMKGLDHKLLVEVKKRQLEVAKRHLCLSEQLEGLLGDVTQQLKDMMARHDKSKGSMFSDLKQLEHLARAIKAATDVSARATGLGTTVKNGHDGAGLLGTGVAILVGVQPKRAEPAPMQALDVEVSDPR